MSVCGCANFEQWQHLVSTPAQRAPFSPRPRTYHLHDYLQRREVSQAPPIKEITIYARSREMKANGGGRATTKNNDANNRIWREQQTE